MPVLLKDTCSKCGARVKDMGAHMRRYHNIRKRSKRRPAGTDLSAVPESAELPTNNAAPGIPNKDLVELEEKVAEAEGIAAPVNPDGSEQLQENPEPDAMENIVLEKEAVEYMLDTLFRGFSKMRKSKVWELDKEELKMISPLATKVANKWMPFVMKKYGEEIILAFTFGQIILAKMMLEREEKKEAAAKLAAAQQQNNGGILNA